MCMCVCVLAYTHTTVSKTIRMPPLVKDQTAFKKKIKYGEKRFSIWRIKILHPAMWHDHDTNFARWLHPAMWNVALGWHAMEFTQMSAILEFYIWFRFWPYHRSRHVILQNFIQIGPSSAEKMTSCRFSRWRISAILHFRGPIMGSLKSPCRLFVGRQDITALNCLVFEKIAYLQFGDRQTDRRTDGHARHMKPLSCRERRLNNSCRKDRILKFMYWNLLVSWIFSTNIFRCIWSESQVRLRGVWQRREGINA